MSTDRLSLFGGLHRFIKYSYKCVRGGIRQKKGLGGNFDCDCHDLVNIKELANRQEMIEKSHRRQLVAEIKKKQALKKQLMSASEMIYSLENCLKVGVWYYWFVLKLSPLKN